MKHDIKEMERRGKEETLQRLLTSHLQLLCSLDMIAEVYTNIIYFCNNLSKQSKQELLLVVSEILCLSYIAIWQTFLLM